MAITLPYTFVQGTVIDASQVNANFSALANGVNNTTGSGATYVLSQSPSIDSPTITTGLTLNGTANVSGAVSLAVPLAVASGGLGVATLPAGQLVQGNGTNPVSGVPLPLAASLGGTGQSALPLSVANGGTGTTAARATLTLRTPPIPEGVQGPNPNMLGLGAVLQITPAVSGNVMFCITGQATMNAAGNTQLLLYYGTGTPPVFAAPATGTGLLDQTWSAFEADIYSPFNLSALAGGLTVGTTYWFDLALVSSGQITTVNPQGYAYEV